ncbi:hypothetical protein [Tenacibaculum sp. M341]|uniref:hypothetical protein n=1 Tax=Tenacibaculum sp. M341 TaxID=2530339 RepID=UPI00104EB6EA|nr:hypothetical protein [Tenacibaculum sp. M341]TCI93589.1 hypothetical protein EYW44_04045 [Tenacibaculum sp. M341]
METKENLESVKLCFSRGYNLGKLITKGDFQELQEKLEAKALDKSSKNYFKFRALSLGFNTALRDRKLLLEKPKKLESLKKLIDVMPNVWEDKWKKKGKDKDNEMEIDF